MFVTRYALTAGIEERPGIKPDETGFIYDRGVGLQVGKDAFHNREDAVKAAEAARLKKIANLQKQIDSLNKLKFL